MPPFDAAMFGLGCLGGLLPDILRVIRERYDPGRPDYWSNPRFWFGVVLSVLVGGLAAWLFSAVTAQDAVVYGFAAPALISQLVGGLTLEKPGRVEREARQVKPFSLLRWWAV